MYFCNLLDKQIMKPLYLLSMIWSVFASSCKGILSSTNIKWVKFKDYGYF